MTNARCAWYFLLLAFREQRCDRPQITALEEGGLIRKDGDQWSKTPKFETFLAELHAEYRATIDAMLEKLRPAAPRPTGQ